MPNTGTAYLVWRLATSWTVGGSNPGDSEVFRNRPDLLLCRLSLLHSGYRITSCFNHPPAFSSKVEERVELYIYSPSGPSWLLPGWILAFPLNPISEIEPATLRLVAQCRNQSHRAPSQKIYACSSKRTFFVKQITCGFTLNLWHEGKSHSRHRHSG
jgi:hypothetical protein